MSLGLECLSAELRVTVNYSVYARNVLTLASRALSDNRINDGVVLPSTPVLPLQIITACHHHLESSVYTVILVSLPIFCRKYFSSYFTPQFLTGNLMKIIFFMINPHI